MFKMLLFSGKVSFYVYVYSVPGVIGTLQALEALKIALEMRDVLSSKLLLFDGENTSFRTMNLRKKNPSCPVCGTNPTIKQLIDYEEFCGASANDKVCKQSLVTLYTNFFRNPMVNK